METKDETICITCGESHGALKSRYVDNACCPRCKHYNAMLSTWDKDDRVFKCRDCGYVTTGGLWKSEAN